MKVLKFHRKTSVFDLTFSLTIGQSYFFNVRVHGCVFRSVLRSGVIPGTRN